MASASSLVNMARRSNLPIKAVFKFRQVAQRVVTEIEALEGRGRPSLQISQGRVHRQE